mgnify:CR=1 FL=1
MSTTKIVDNVIVQMTAAELDEQQVRLAFQAARRPIQEIEKEIARLEALETPTRMAEAALGDTTWLRANRDLIAIERAKL